MEQLDQILIIGGGLNGPTLALALAQAGIACTVVDALPLPTRRDSEFDGRAYALSLGSMRLLKALGLWQGLAANAQAMCKITVTDGRPGEGPSPFVLRFDAAETEDGPAGFMVEDRFLRQALLDAMEASPLITTLSGHKVIAQEITAQGVHLKLENGDTLAGRLLIGADGKTSGTAARAGISRTPKPYGQTAIACAIAHAEPHQSIAHQFFMPTGPLAILPLTGHRSGIVWSTSTQIAKDLMALDEAAFIEALKPAFGSFLGDISLASKRAAFALELSLTDRFIAPRVALVGDAAHGLHPVAGQGLNAGLRDVAALAEVLIDAQRRGEDYASLAVLTRYQNWRRPEIMALAAVTDGTTRLFSNDNTTLRGLRDLGLGMINAISPLRRAMMREAAGVSNSLGGLPRLMR